MKLNYKGEWHENNKVFTGLDGRPLHPDSVTGWFHRFIKRNNFPPICVHSLRHTNATLLIAGGTDIKTVANRLGHSTPSVTGSIYAHAIKSADEAAADRLNNIFNPIKRTNKGQIFFLCNMMKPQKHEPPVYGGAHFLCKGHKRIFWGRRCGI